MTSDTTLIADRVGPVVIARDNVTLDCAGHSVTGTGRDMGIVADGRTGITVRNCDVSGFATGFWIASTEESRFEGNASHDNVVPGGKPAGWNLGAGMWITSSNGNEFVANRVFDNPGDGFDFMQSSANSVVENVASGNAMAGVYVGKSADGNIFERNVVERNVRGGFLLSSNSDTTATGNVARDNGDTGFSINDAARGRYEGNQATGNAGSGFWISDGSTGVELASNHAEANVGSGFNVNTGSTDNRLVGNTAIGNDFTGIIVTTESTGNYLSDNWAIGNLRGFGVSLGAYANTLERNTARDNGPGCESLCGGFILYQTSGNVLRQNVSVANTGHGYGLHEAVANTLISNAACDNSDGNSFEDALSSGNSWSADSFCEPTP
ncbi:MAG TPA: right-handed parallel beta-helix repeat-containing protein [Candidatus Limnocylindrales bacterium]|nr:right-handed parallel beta-helix repeat-containing protein [Candidatus Limnocylindrales bacterium]